MMTLTPLSAVSKLPGSDASAGRGNGRIHQTIDEFTTDHWISVQHQRRDYPI